MRLSAEVASSRTPVIEFSDMDLLNSTPFSVGYLLGQVHHPASSLTVVVKGTFELTQGKPAVPATGQLPLMADTPGEDDGVTSLRYPADLVHHKPRADLLLVGHCHTATPEVNLGKT